MTESQRLEQAAEWFDRIDEFSEQEKLLFAEWLTCADNQQAFTRIATALGQPEVKVAAQRIKDSVTVTLVPTASASISEEDIKDSRVTKTFWNNIGLASAAAVALFAALFTLNNNLPDPTSPPHHQAANSASYQSQSKQFITGIGEHSSSLLKDGSIIYLNGDSALTVNHNENFREVSLPHGQAYFDIAHEPRRPFIVQLDTASVQVVGTAFDIDRLADKTEIRVYEGLVKVNADKALMLHKGEGVILRNGQWQSTFTFTNMQLPDWRTGWLEVNQQPLGDVVIRLNRYTDKPIRINGQTDLPVSGRFNLKVPQQALQLLSAMDDLTLTELPDYYQLSVTL